MLESLLGKKIGMTQVVDGRGRMVPVTVLQAGPCSILQVKTEAVDGYEALQVGFDDKKEKNTTKPLLGHARKAGVAPKRFVREIPADGEEHAAGEAVSVDVFADVHFVDVVGTSKGKGFAGPMKRWGFAGRKATHGAKGYRVRGSIGQSAWPARVFRGTKMAGRMGGRRVMTRFLEVVKVDPDKNLILVKGSVPGSNGSYVIIHKSTEYMLRRKKKH